MTNRLKLHLVAIPLAAALSIAPGMAASVMSFKAKYVDIAVKVDDAFKAVPGLFENLAAEGKRWGARTRAETEKDWRTDREMFKPMAWSYERSYERRSAVGRYVSVLRADYAFTGGAHPNTVLDTILWDAEAKKRISIRPFFNETADNGPTMTALARLVRLAVAREKMARDPDQKGRGTSPEQYLAQDTMVSDAIKPQLVELGPVTLAPSTERNKSSGLTFHYSPYVVGSYAEGIYTAFVPWTEFRTLLSPEGTAIFAGTRPKSDIQAD